MVTREKGSAVQNKDDKDNVKKNMNDNNVKQQQQQHQQQHQQQQKYGSHAEKSSYSAASPMLFKRIHQVPNTVAASSRDGCIYLYRAMQIMGWIPTKHCSWLYKFWTLWPFIWGIGYLPLGFLGTYMEDIKQFSPEDFLTSLQVSFNALGSSIKSSTTYILLWRLHRAKEILNKLDERCHLDSELFKIRQVIARANHIFLIFTIVYCSFAGSTFLSGVLGGAPPWRLYNPYCDWRKDKLHFWMQSLFEYAVMSTAVMQDQISDTYPLIFLVIIRAHISILKDRISNLRKDTQNTNDEHYEELIKCILDHKLILEYCNTITPIISITIFVQFLLCGIVLGLTLINLLFFANLWSGLAAGIFVVTILLQTFPFCYVCNMVIDDCDDLTLALFQVNWWDADHRYNTALKYFLLNVQRPIIFNAMGVFQISLSSNISVAKFAFSVMTIARQMNLAEKFQ